MITKFGLRKLKLVVPMKSVLLNESVSGYFSIVEANCFACCLYILFDEAYGFLAQLKSRIMKMQTVYFMYISLTRKIYVLERLIVFLLMDAFKIVTHGLVKFTLQFSN